MKTRGKLIAQDPAVSTWKTVLDVVLIATGVFGVGFSLMHLFINVSNIPEFFREPTEVLLLVVSVLLVAVGIERRLAFGEIHSALLRIDRSLTTAVPARVLTDEAMVYEEAIRIVSSAEDSDALKATSLSGARYSYDQMVEYGYLAAIAERIKLAQDHSGQLSYRVIIGHTEPKGAEPPQNVQQRVRERRQRFREKGVLKQLHIHTWQNTWPLDLLVAGDSLLIGFTTLGYSGLAMGLRITDRQFVQTVSQWYDDNLWIASSKEEWTGDESISAKPVGSSVEQDTSNFQ